ncbi:MAG: MBL fold metallo-hydrolase [Rubrivivax sp.]|nr:MBL fold metallo-hydrolase [Rubrivivax sp.]
MMERDGARTHGKLAARTAHAVRAVRRALAASVAIAASAALAGPAALAALLVPLAAAAQTLTLRPSEPAAARVGEVQALAEGVWWLPSRFERGRQPDGASLILQGREGLVIIDTGRHAEHAGALREWARRRGQPIRAVINTHWHLDHLGGNALLRRALPGIRTHASAAVRDAVEQRMPASDADLAKMLQDPSTDAATRRMIEIDRALYAERALLLPDVVLEQAPRDIELAGRALRVGVLRGVSGGDAWVLDRASGTLAVGDFVTLPAPFLDTACAETWRAALGELDALPFERVVPGHGPVMSRDDFRRYRNAFDRLLGCAGGDKPVAECSAAWVADLGPLLPAASQRAAAGMLQHYFAERLRASAEDRARFCPG